MTELDAHGLSLLRAQANRVLREIPTDDDILVEVLEGYVAGKRGPEIGRDHTRRTGLPWTPHCATLIKEISLLPIVVSLREEIGSLSGQSRFE